MTRNCLSVLALGLLTGGVPDQQRSPEHARDLTRIDVAVVTRTGQPVLDLKPEEVEVRLAGRVRPIRSLQLVSAGLPRGADSAALPPPFGTNADAAAARALVLMIDEDSFRPGREAPLRDAVGALIMGLAPADRVALVTVPYGGVKVPLTTEHSRIPASLASIVGGAPQSETGSELACRTRRSLDALIGYLQSLGYRDAPATIVFVTGGLAAPRRDAPVTMAPGMCELPVGLYQQIGSLAGAARGRFYIVQPVDLFNTGTVARENIAGAGFRGSDNPIEGIEHLAGVTGGKILALTGSPGGALGRVLRETSAHYVIGVAPRDEDRSGRPIPLEVKVLRPDVEVRTGREIAFPKHDPAARALVNPSPREMLGVMTVFRDLPLRTTAFSSLHTDGKTLRVTAIAEPLDPNTKLTALVTALFDRDGKVAANWVATPQELARTPIAGAMAAEPGAYRLRTAAIDAEGRSGTADYDLVVELAQTGPLKLSSLILGLSRDGAFVPRLEFSAEPVAIGFLEMYGGAAGMRVSATLEIARTLNGPALLTVPLAIASAGEGRYTARGAIPIAALSPGDYAVRAVIGLGDQPPTRVVQTLRKR